MKSILKKKIIKNKKSQLKTEVSFFEISKRLFVAWFVMFFCAIVITQQESFWLKISNSPDQVVFMFPGTPSDWGIDESETGVHGSAGDWQYLFEDEETNQQIYKPDLNVLDSDLEYIDHVDKDFFPNKDYFPNNDENTLFEGIGKDFSDITTSGSNQTGIIEKPKIKQTCITPWGERLAHDDFVLAYEQRKDVNNLCNVQKRYCNDGKLLGTYLQKSCKEHTLYSYVKPEAISYTEKPVDTFLQPNKPSLSGANFDTHGKINGKTDPINTWGNQSSGRPSDIISISQTPLSNTKCKTPWGEQVKNGKFIKAYKSSVGLIDMPCDVEIRLCVGGNLKGYYTNRTCTFKKMTYRDYLIQNYDENQPTIGDLINSVDNDETQTKYNNRIFWKWLDKYF